MDQAFMKRAVELAVANVRQGGGPFAALIVKDGAIIASGVNQVTQANDPTAHAEVVAIREACRALNHFQLTGCDVYTSCEPCPMCLGALYWARPACIYYAATHEDAAAAGFDDSLIYRELAANPGQRSIRMIRVGEEHATEPFERWRLKSDKVSY